MKNVENSEKIMLEEIRQELAYRSGESDFDENSSLKNDLYLDSLDIVEFADFLKKRFDISLEAGDIEQFETVGDIYNFCRQKFGK